MSVVRVWDLPLRLFHWCLVLAVLAMVGTVSLGWMEWHMRCGYFVLTLLLFRLVWGFVGGHWARFSSFIPGPRSLASYLRSKESPTSVGHNLLGAMSVLAMLLVLGLQVVSGMASDNEISTAGPWASHLSSYWVGLATHYHTKVGKFLLLVLVVLHVGAIVRYRRLGQDLVTPMLNGDKIVSMPAPASKDTLSVRLLGATCFIVCLAGVLLMVRALA